MKTISHAVTDPQGLHARLCVQLALAASQCPGEALVTCRGATCSAKDPVALLALGARQHDTITVTFCEETPVDVAAEIEQIVAAL